MNESLTIPKGDKRARAVIKAIKKENETIAPKDCTLKYEKMASAPLVFYRGTNHLFWNDFARSKRLKPFGNEHTRTWLQGDLHAYNYGSFDNSKGTLIYDLNDFDEAIVADYQYDLWRMTISMVLIAHQNDDLEKSQLEKVIDTFAQSYLDTLSAFEGKRKNPQSFCTLTNTFGKLNHFLMGVDAVYTRAFMLNKWAPVDTQSNERRFNLKSRKLDEVTPDEHQEIRKAMTAYRTTITHAKAKNDAYFNVIDVARRLQAGTGSLGTRRFYVLIQGDKPTPHILDVKQQSKPTPYQYLGKKARKDYDDQYENDAQRHAVAYRALTRNTDPFLGWMELDDGFYSVRERSPFKEAFPGEALDTRTAFSELAEQWAEILAADHTCAQEDLPKEVLLLTKKRDQQFLEQIRTIAFSYADTVQADWQQFRTALGLKKEDPGTLAFTPPSYRTMLPR